LIGFVLTQMSGRGARIGSQDLQLQRRVDEIVYESRVKLADTFNKLADEATGTAPRPNLQDKRR
jgi:hypothetical protein